MDSVADPTRGAPRIQLCLGNFCLRVAKLPVAVGRNFRFGSCAKPRRESTYSRAEREFLRSFLLCEAMGLEIWLDPGPLGIFTQVRRETGKE